MHPDIGAHQSSFRDTHLKRIAWITPHYPPDRGGVSDHSSEMVNVLRSTGHDVLVCSRPHEIGFDHLDAELLAYRPEVIVVAFTPLAYAPHTGGLAPAFVRWSIGLRRRFGCKAILLAHEASLPFTFHAQKRQFKLAALAAAQMTQFAVLAACFDSVLFSNAGTQRDWAKRLPHWASRFHTIRICSNIPYCVNAAPDEALEASGARVPKPTILFFGTGHDSVLFDYVEAAFAALLEVEPAAGLVIVGMSPEKLRRLRPSLADLGDRVQALGYVSAETVSLWLQVATMVLAPLIEGVSARKGTVMAAMQHGRAIVTTRGVHTLEDIAWDDVCLLSPLEREAFVALALNAFNDLALRDAIGRAAQHEYDAHASASVTASAILQYATEDTEPMN